MKAIKGGYIGHFADAQALEQKGEPEAAVALYEQLLKQSPKNLRIIQRLMVLFRKLGNHKKEEQYINAAIRIYEQKYAFGNSLDKKAAAISKQLNKMLGHTDKKGNAVFVADEILKLRLRKTRLQKRLQASLKKKK